MLLSKLLVLSLLPLVFAKGGGDGDDGGNDPDDTNGDCDSDDASCSSTATATGPAPSSTSAPGTGITGNTTGLTGDMQCTTLMCISAVVNGSEVQYVLQSTGASKLGWMAMGFGQQMANTPMVIMWSNSDGSITLSQRQAPAEVMPTVVSSPPRVATQAPALSSTSGTQPTLGYSITANSDTNQNIIWAFGTTNPGSSAVDATLLQHLQSGTLTLDLTKPIASNSTPGSPASNSTSGGPSGSVGSAISIPLLPYQKLIIAHAVMVSVGFLFLLPAGALFARYLRTFTARWFQGHWIIQFAIAGPTIVAGVALGVGSVRSAGALHLNDSHKKWGVAIFALYFAQCALGAIIHFVKPKNVKSRRPPQNYLHAVFGLAIFGLSFYQVRTGYKTEWVLSTGRDALPGTINIVWYIWVVLIPALYTVGLFLLPKQFNQERKRKHPRSISEDSNADDVSLNRPEMQERSRSD